MRKPISTQNHGIMDYLAAGALLALPRVLGFSRPLACAVESVAATKLLVNAFTDHEAGLVRKVPMTVHLAMDVANGAALCALPFVLADEDDNEDRFAKAALIGMGLNEISMATMTRTTPTQRSLPRKLGRSIRQTSSNGVRAVRERVGV